jgi:hypothetical protein
MKMTIELPDHLHRRTKAEAALRGCKIDNLIQEGLELVLGNPATAATQAGLAELMKRANGIFSSHVADLGSNPEHLENLGRKRRDR